MLPEPRGGCPGKVGLKREGGYGIPSVGSPLLLDNGPTRHWAFTNLLQPGARPPGPGTVVGGGPPRRSKGWTWTSVSSGCCHTPEQKGTDRPCLQHTRAAGESCGQLAHPVEGPEPGPRGQVTPETSPGPGSFPALLWFNQGCDRSCAKPPFPRPALRGSRAAGPLPPRCREVRRAWHGAGLLPADPRGPPARGSSAPRGPGSARLAPDARAAKEGSPLRLRGPGSELFARGSCRGSVQVAQGPGSGAGRDHACTAQHLPVPPLPAASCPLTASWYPRPTGRSRHKGFISTSIAALLPASSLPRVAGSSRAVQGSEQGRLLSSSSCSGSLPISAVSRLNLVQGAEQCRTREHESRCPRGKGGHGSGEEMEQEAPALGHVPGMPPPRGSGGRPCSQHLGLSGHRWLRRGDERSPAESRPPQIAPRDSCQPGTGSSVQCTGAAQHLP